MVEANAQLQLFKLPEQVFGKYEQIIRQAQFKCMQRNWFDGEDPRLAFKRMQIQAETQMET